MKGTRDLKDKEFTPRNSLLSELLEINHCRAASNIVASLLIVTMLNETVQDYLETGLLSIMGRKVLQIGFDNFFAAFKLWVLMQLGSCASYAGFKFWSCKYREYSSNHYLLKVINTVFLGIWIIFLLAFLIIPSRLILREGIGPFLRALLLIEQVRMIMKIYAFVRSTAPCVIASNQVGNGEDKKVYRARFLKFLYFMFAPTLVYRDEYPRTAEIRWRVVLKLILEILVSVFCIAFILERFVMIYYHEYDSRIFEIPNMVSIISNNVLPFGLIYFLAFYLVFHCWHNLFAEILRFADRCFYKDWWNSPTIDIYYRKWNVIVHDWFYTYVYKDANEMLHNKLYAKYVVFFISALMHDYVFAFTFRMFNFMMFFFFMGNALSISMNYTTEDSSNVVMSLGLILGNGIVLAFYTLEHHARLYCPLANDSNFRDNFMPRSWICVNITNNGEKWTNDLKDKEFVARESLLTTLRKIDHFQSVFNIFTAVLVTLFLSTTVQDFLETGSFNSGLRTLKSSSENFSTALRTWIIMQCSTLLFFAVYQAWANKRHEYSSKPSCLRILDTIAFVAFVMYQVAFVFIPAKLILKEYIAPFASLLLLIEQLRMLMKTYAFVRSTTPRIMTKNFSNEKNGKIYNLEFSKFVYFLFAPTLVYKDAYPRNAQIRWRLVALHFVESVISLLYLSFIFERFILMRYKKIDDQSFKMKAFILAVFNTMLPSLLVYLVGFYMVFHSWHNFTAELLRFSDRMFYKDWWNSPSIDTYFRKWNIIVHDWFYVYVYKDAYDKLHNKLYAKYIVFFISAIMHEYVFAISFRLLFYPVMLLIFINVGRQTTLKSGSESNANLYMWFGHCMGNGLIFTLYVVEYYAKLYCVSKSDNFYDTLMPKSWNCFSSLSDTDNIL
ncbi:hypothetical protein QAD02_001227 [Eretmocerus hayati]|uniref:Uncharacterized protein n=1 Tax=Eretmocerus hayati TaxID=131215 RepID=A0ACC2NFM7_9HYME|nr:hypothetical protein QAD02_001227 [Eretmocerus hayati]